MQNPLNPIESRADSQQLEQLLSQIAAGDRDALAQLYSQTRTAVYAAALGVLRNAHDAQDITQDTFVRVWERADQYRPGGSPLGWLVAVCRNEARMYLRRANRVVSMDDDAWNALPDPAQTCPDDRVLLQDALAQLQDPARQVVLLHAAGLKHREIAHQLQIPLATSLSHYRRAMKKLKQILEGDDRT